MKNLKLFIPLAVFLVLGIFLLRGLDRDPTELPSALISRPVPDFDLPDLLEPGRSHDQTLFQGRVSLLNVWGTWCVACRVEHPFLMELAGRGVDIIGMNYKDEQDAARQWLVDKGDPYRINFVDRDGRLAIDLGVFGAPETYLVDHRGVIHYKHVGVVDEAVWGQMQPLYDRLVAAAGEGGQ
ncbi:MAG: DsbE family thiol:disulfide interchange protein [Porticoccaceae bacterium]|jgi:cytochrome c biogenesis protein CcmG/thiol:disulfide interchange protein DsbE|nr:DsbE family thiol:disulfide interchange protein [Porticoccaceae bacterium]MEA3301584.1 DsbE family thiol:disulfide interchange protein [Pseudomonadota bacterium]HLS98816.1 DsbE family thiol:disulfide interchange protein [Porticoccaceae bacterium]